MSVIATDSTRFSAVVKYEFEPAKSLCREAVTLYGSAATYVVGTVLGKYLVTPTATSAAGAANTGNGAMGAITMTAKAGLRKGVYTLVITKAAANAGDFVLKDPDGDVVGTGTVAVAFAQGGFSFTLADGATDFAQGDSFAITVDGTEKYKIVEATATDGSEVAAAVLIANYLGESNDIVLAATTDTKALVLARGPAILVKSALTPGATVNTAAELALMYDQLKALGFTLETAA